MPTTMKNEICRKIGIDPDVLTPPDAIGFGEVLSRFIDTVNRWHDLVPWSGTSLDGVAGPEAETENETSYEFCGIFHTLGGKADWNVPVHLHLEIEGDALTYELWIGRADEKWANWSDSKRWKAAYHLCRNELVEPWPWQYRVKGTWGVNENNVE